MKEQAYVNVSIGEADVSLRVQTNTGAKVSGRVVVDGQPAAGGGPPGVWISSAPPPGTLGPYYPVVPPARAQETGRFELAGLRGPMVLSAEIAGGALLSIRRRGEELAGKTMMLVGTERFDDLVVEVTKRVAHLDVNVASAGAAGEPEPVIVVLFSEDPKRWHPGFTRYEKTSALPVSAGETLRPARTRMTRIPPGRYLIAAIHDAGLSDPTEVAVLGTTSPARDAGDACLG